MRIIKRQALVDFWKEWPQAEGALSLWHQTAKKVRWKNLADVRATFGQTDWTKVRSGATVAIFDIGGNKFRLVARVSFEKQKIYVLRLMTHKEYDRNQWKEQL